MLCYVDRLVSDHSSDDQTERQTQRNRTKKKKKMELKEKVELKLAIKHQLMVEEDDANNYNKRPTRTRNKTSPTDSSAGGTETSSFVGVSDEQDEDDNTLLLSGLLSQLETLKNDGTLRQPEPSAVVEKVPSPAVGNLELRNDIVKNDAPDGGSSENGSEEIIKELRNIRRQNFITHCLLSAMIVLQLSEVSLILKVKKSVSHPFKSLGSMVTGMLKGPNTGTEEREKESAAEQKIIAASSLPGLKIPDMPQMELPVLHFSAGDD